MSNDRSKSRMSVANPKPIMDWIERNGYTLGAAAAELRISTTTLRKIRKGVEVRVSVLEVIAKELGCGVSQLILNSNKYCVPDQPDFYESIIVGYYLDNHRSGDGRIQMCREEVRLSALQRNEKGKILLKGQISNEEGRYKVTGSVINPGLVSFVARDEASPDVGFAAAFTAFVEGVLHGVWIGLTHDGVPCVYRMFLGVKDFTTEEAERQFKKIQYRMVGRT